MMINADELWKNTNLAGTYRFVEMYNNYPVYKVSFHISKTLNDVKPYIWLEET